MAENTETVTISKERYEELLDRATYEAAFKILLALDECVDKAILQLEELQGEEGGDD